MKQIIIFENEIYRERAIKDRNSVTLVKEFKNIDTGQWEDIEQKIITKEEFEAIKKLFEGKEDK